VIERFGAADLVRRVGASLLNNLSEFGTGSVVPVCRVAKVWRLLILVSKEMFSRVELLVSLAILLDVCLEKREEE